MVSELKLGIISALVSLSTTVVGIGFWSGSMSAKTAMTTQLLNQISAKQDSNAKYLENELKEIRHEISVVKTNTTVNSTILQERKNEPDKEIR